METLTQPATFIRKLVAEDSKQIKDLQTNVETYAEQLQAVFIEGKRHGITFILANLKEQLKTPEIAFKKELQKTEIKTDKFLMMARTSYDGLRYSLPYLTIEDGKVTIRQNAIDEFCDSNYRFFLSSAEDESDLKNICEYGKTLLSLQRFINKNKYAWQAVKDASSLEIMEILQRNIKQ